MSLELAAKHLAAQGRGPDKQLVHMSPREVAGLQALAMAHGGSLTTNPDTGLPEAGFLDNLLPTIIGAGLMYATGGAAAGFTPGMIGLGLGAFETARTGNLQKGLMAGLGAYGGAGMFGALAGASGASGAAGAAGAGAAQAAGAVPQAAAAPGFDVAGLAASPVDVSQFASPGVTAAAEAAGRQGVVDKFAQEGFKLGPTGEIVPLDAVDRLSAGDKALRSIVPETVTQQPQIDAVSRLSPGDMALRSTPYQPPTVAERFAAMPTKDKLKYGLAALSPALLAQPKYKAPELDREQYRYAYTPGRTGPRPDDYQGEYTYFRPSYTRLAAGGPVAAMSAANVYDMQNARGGVSDMGIDNSTGMQKLADGGAAGTSGYEGYKGYSQPGQDQYQYAYDPKTQRYRDIVSKGVAAGADDALPFVDTMGGGIAMGTPDASVAANPATTIAIGQALQGYGQLAFAPGAAIAGMLGQGMVNSGINALGAMESQAEADAAAASTLGQSVADAFGVAYGGAGFNSSGAGGISGTGGNIGDASTGGSTVGIDAMGPGGPGGDTSGGAVGGGFGAGDPSGFARGGITGTGELNLNIPLEFGNDAINGFGQGPSNAGFNVNQGPLDLGRGNPQGFGQANANGYRAVGSGAASSPPGFLTPNSSNTVGLNENPNILGTQLASKLGAVNQNPFAAQPTPEMIAAQREASLFNPAGTLADLQRRVGGREQPFDEFKQARSRTALRHPGDRMPTDAEFQNMYQNYLQDRNNNLAKIGDMQQTLSSQAQQKEMFDRVNAMQQRLPQMAIGGLAALARGGISHLGDYSDGGRLLRGPGDGVSDSIPAMIGKKQPARLADGEFVVPARIVSELGNGSTEAGARKLYAMMDRIQKARGKTVGKGKVAKNSRAEKYLPA